MDEFELIWETNFSYPQPWYVSRRGFLLLHTRYTTDRRLLCWVASADGSAWSEPQVLAEIDRGHYQVSWQGEERVGTAFNEPPATESHNVRTNLYYLETSDFGGTWQNVQGEMIRMPLREASNPALACDYRRRGELVYLKDLNYSQGWPVVLYLTSPGYQAGPENAPRRWTTAHWTGAAWDVQSGIQSDSSYDTGCLHVERDGDWRIVGPTLQGPQPYNPGGEMAVWGSRDLSHHWVLECQLTHGSAYNHTYARRPVNAHPGFYAFWADGHGRRPSEARLYLYDRTRGQVRQLPPAMEEGYAVPQPVY